MTKALAKPTALTAQAARDWKRAAGDWLSNLGSDRTRRAYGEAWRVFLAWADLAPADVTQSHVIAYRRHLETTASPKTGKVFSQTTINLHLSALSSFFVWAKAQGLREDNPTEGVNRKAVTPYGKATWLRPEDGQDLQLLQAIDTTTAQGLRDRAIMLLILTGAFRVAEVARLTVGQLRRQGDLTFLKYEHKGGEVEEVILAREAADALAAYLQTRPGLADSAPIFTATEAGRASARRMLHALGRDLGAEEKTLTPRAIAYVLNTYCDRAFGPGHGIHPHSLRHTAAQALIFEGGSVTEVSRLLKHKSMAVTTIYLHATNKTDAKTAATLGRRYAQADAKGI